MVAFDRRERWLRPVACLFAIAGADGFAFAGRPPDLVWSLPDEVAHAATGLLVVGAFSAPTPRWMIITALGASVALDMDHVPDLLGLPFHAAGAERPYTHALFVVGIALLAGWAARGRARNVLVLCSAILLVHLLRDSAEPERASVSLWWPLTADGIRAPYWAYAACILGLTGVATLRRFALPTSRTGRESHPRDRLARL